MKLYLASEIMKQAILMLDKECCFTSIQLRVKKL